MDSQVTLQRDLELFKGRETGHTRKTAMLKRALVILARPHPPCNALISPWQHPLSVYSKCCIAVSQAHLYIAQHGSDCLNGACQDATSLAKKPIKMDCPFACRRRE